MSNKTKKTKDRAVTLMAVVGIVAFAAIVMMVMGGQPASVTFTTTGEPVGDGVTSLFQTPTTTLLTQNIYDTGTALTTKNMYRTVGQSKWTNVAGGATIAKAEGTQIEIVTGIDLTDETAEPYGPIVFYTFKHVNTDELEILVANDALASDIGTQYYDEDDNSATNQATSANTNLKVSARFTAATDEDFGNINVGETSNVLVFKYNSTQAEGVSVSTVTIDGLAVKVSPIATPSVHEGATGFDTQAYTFPVLQDSAKVVVNYEVDAKATVINTTISTFTLSVYDSGYYLNTKDGANEVLGGVMDENGDEIGAANPVTITPAFGQ